MSDTPLAELASVWDHLDRVPPTHAAGLAYAQGMHRRPLRYYIDRVRKLGLRGARALDAGCGTGTWSFALRSSFDEVIGIDITEERVRIAQWLTENGKVTGVEFRAGSILDTGIPDRSIDFVFCYSVLISSLPIEQVLTEFRRILKPGGAVYISLNGIGWSYYLRDERGQEDQKYLQMGTQGIYNTLVRGLPDHERAAITGSVAWTAGDPGGKLRRLYHRVLRCFSRLRVLAGRIAGPAVERIARSPGHSRITVGVARLYLYWWIARLARPGMPRCRLHDIVTGVQCECGDPYLVRLAQDVFEMAGGRRSEFSHSHAGRGYLPEEMAGCCEAAGLIDFQWATEGLISGSVLPDPPAPIHVGYFGGHLKVWEFLAFRPDDTLGECIDPAWFRANSTQQARLSYVAQARTPIITNVDAATMPRALVDEARRRGRAAGGMHLVEALAARLCDGARSEEESIERLLRFVQDVLVNHPVVQPFECNGTAVTDPATSLFLGIGRCGAAAHLASAMCNAIGLSARIESVPGHVFGVALADGDEIVLEADAFKKGVLAREPDGRLLRYASLRENPRVVDGLLDFNNWWSVHLRDMTDIWGRRPFGYVLTGLGTRIYSSYFEENAPLRFKPDAPRLTIKRRGAGWLLKWNDVTPPDGAAVEYWVLIRRETRGWGYDVEPHDLARLQSPTTPEFERCTDQTQLGLDAFDGAHIEVVPRLRARPDVYCWPSNEVCARQDGQE